MFDTINGLPVHALVVHGVVVLLPLAVVGTIAIALRPAWRSRYGILVVIVTAIATALVPVATQSGEKLETHVGDPGKHADLGATLIWFALPLLVLTIALVWLDRRPPAGSNESNGSSGVLTAVNIVAALSVIAGIAAGVQVYRIGESGARAAWGERVQNTVPQGD